MCYQNSTNRPRATLLRNHTLTCVTIIMLLEDAWSNTAHWIILSSSVNLFLIFVFCFPCHRRLHRLHVHCDDGRLLLFLCFAFLRLLLKKTCFFCELVFIKTAGWCQQSLHLVSFPFAFSLAFAVAFAFTSTSPILLVSAPSLWITVHTHFHSHLRSHSDYRLMVSVAFCSLMRWLNLHLQLCALSIQWMWLWMSTTRGVISDVSHFVVIL